MKKSTSGRQLGKLFCAHLSCNCRFDKDEAIEKNGKVYCSDHCAEEPDDGRDCACGHADCGLLSPTPADSRRIER